VGTVAIKLVNVYKRYEYGKVEALKNVSFEFAEGLFYMIVGPSGSGKTTLLNIITGVDTPTSGQVFVDDIEISKLKESERRRIRLQKFGIVFQFFFLVPYLTGLENVMLPLRFLNHDKKLIREKAYNALKMVNAAHLADKYPTEMSAGEMQRIAIARAIASNPKYLVADEPTAALDWKNKVAVWDLFKKLQKELKITVIAVSHEREFTSYADVVIELRDGEIYAVKRA